MIFLQILIVIVCLIVLILLCPLWAVIRYDGELSVNWGYLFWKFRYYPDVSEDLSSDKLTMKQKRKLKQKLMKKEAREERLSKKKKGKKSAKRKLKESLSVRSDKGVIKELGGILRLLRILILRFGKRLRVKIKRFEVVAASDDAATTAYLFGAFSQLLSYGLALADRYTNVKLNNKRVAVKADFCREESSVNAEVVLHMSLANFIGFLFTSLWEAAKDSMDESTGDDPKPLDNIENKKGISL